MTQNTTKNHYDIFIELMRSRENQLESKIDTLRRIHRKENIDLYKIIIRALFNVLSPGITGIQFEIQYSSDEWGVKFPMLYISSLSVITFIGQEEINHVVHINETVPYLERFLYRTNFDKFIEDTLLDGENYKHFYIYNDGSWEAS